MKKNAVEEVCLISTPLSAGFDSTGFGCSCPGNVVPGSVGHGSVCPGNIGPGLAGSGSAGIGDVAPGLFGHGTAVETH